MNIDIFIVCNNYWKRFEKCIGFWTKCNYENNDVKFHIVSKEESPPYEMPNGFYFYGCGDFGFCKNEKSVESKPLMLRYALSRMGRVPDWIVFSDADILPPEDIFSFFNNHDYLLIANRVDLTEFETKLFLSDNIDIDDVQSREFNLKKQGMGWFQAMRWNVFMYVNSKINWDRVGYSLFDFEVLKIAKTEFRPRVIETSKPFYHLHHGDDGANWNGTKEKL